MLDDATKARIKALGTEGRLTPEIARLTGVQPDLVRFHLKQAGVYQPAPRAHKYTAEQRARVLELRLVGRKLNEIVRETGVEEGSVRAFLSAAGVRLTSKQRGANRTILKGDRAEKALQLRREGVDLRAIRAETSVGQTALKKLFRANGVTVPREVAVRNAWAAMQRTRPEHMKEMRARLTPEVRRRAKEAIRAWYAADPQRAEMVGVKSRTWWATKTLEERRAMRPTGRASSGVQAMVERNGVDDPDELMAQYAKAFGGEFLGRYEGSKTRCRWRCKQGHEFMAIPNTVQQGHWCPACSIRISRIQEELYAFVLSIAPDAVLDDRSVLKEHLGWRGELDVYVPSRRFGLELDGLFWHSMACPSYRPNKTRDKAAAARAAGVGFLMVFEDEWRDKRALVEEMIRVRLGVFKGLHLDARALELRRLDRNVQFAEFFARAHLAGHTPAHYGYGLFADGMLVAAVSVRKHQGNPEIARLATLPGVLVRGGAGRLIAAVRREETRPIVSFSDNRLSTGEVYRALGFRENTISSQPGYFYTDFVTRIHHTKCRRRNASDVLAKFPNEKSQALGGVFSREFFGDDRPLYRIEDAGCRRWFLDP